MHFWLLIDEGDVIYLFNEFNEFYNVGSCSLILSAALLMNFYKIIIAISVDRSYI